MAKGHAAGLPRAREAFRCSLASTLLSETRRKSPGKRPAGRQRTCQGRRDTFRCSLVPNVAFWNQKKISRKAPGRWPKDTLLGRQGRRDTFRCSLVPNVAFWNQKKISWKAPGRSPKNTLLGRQGRRETFPLLGRQRRRETFQGSLVPNVALCHWKANGKHPGDGRTCCWAAKGAAKPLFLGRAPPADGWGRRIYIVIYWFYIGYISWYEKYKCWYCHVKSCKHLYIYIA